jgi:hypothetical protein
MTEAPIGRSETFNAITSRLAASTQSLIIVAGNAGSGRTFLLRHVAAAAGQLGYRVLQGSDSEPVTVEASTTVADFRRRFEGLLMEHPQRPYLPRYELRRDDSDLTAINDPADLQIMQLIRRLSPVLILVDGFRPSTAFAAWLIESLIPRIRQSADRVAAVIADNQESLRPLRKLADLAVTLGALNSREVRAELTRAATGFSPGLTEAELDQYAKASVTDPATFSALLTVFNAYAPASAADQT